ncbi:MAG: HAMP domain-containing protein [Prolixibacteraceae bacterium]|nr:HAMP domain-containing protein [Prolixibacteraceae bacterium]
MKKVELKKNVLSYIQDKHSKMFDKEKLRVTLSAKLAIYLLFILITFSIVIDITYQSHKQIHLKIFAAEKAAKKLEYSSQIRSGADSLIKSITKYIATDNDFYQHNYKNQYLKVKEIHKKLKNLDLSKEETSIIDSIEINLEYIAKYANFIFQNTKVKSNNDKERYLKIIDYNIENKLFTRANDISDIAIRNIGVKRNELEIKLSQASERIFLTFLLSILFSLIFAYHLWSRFVKPIKALSDATEALGRGNKIELLKPSGHDEIAALTRSFKRMNKSIRKSQLNLIKERKRFIENILDTIPSGIIVISKNLDTIYTNRCFFELFDLRQHQDKNINIDELIQKETLPIELKDAIIENYPVKDIEFPYWKKR